MSNYLQVRAGPYQLLLDADGIHEILELDSGTDAEAAGHRDWRGRILTAVNGRAMLGLKDAALPSGHAGVVYSIGGEDVPVILELDKVERLRHAEDGAFLPLPPVPERTFLLFDGVLPDREAGIQLYHLRRPLDMAAVCGPKEEPVAQVDVSQDENSPVEAEQEAEQQEAAPAKKRRGRGKRRTS
jgi:chemotaxis signal transduction protein